MVILVDLSAIFGVSTVNFSPFQGPNRLDALLPQSGKIFQYHNEVPHAKFLRENASCQISPTTCQAPENFDDPGSLYSESNLFRRFC